MKVYIGPFKYWIGPYQLLKPLKYLGISEETRDRWADKLPQKPFDFLDRLRVRKVKVRIDKYDIWDMFTTLGLIILPMLKRFRAESDSYPLVDVEDYPYALRPTDKDSFGTEAGWHYVLDEMIWAFQNDDCDINFTNHVAWHARVENGYRLFGKYYRNLWS